ncbi:hypothetical protein [Sphingomonas crocodyli]|uniref:Uncharacterized protein n=1 Tax=Sphingomonas crocodyli TaxID=1979270 RepID=A0A437M6G3_9SPHN|nr:hypothetical protein [Sphingomonas crocodyli]RVT93136.1 hypothetical protein EOD43_04370 [Sphingomonas crocodyli]
MLTIAVEGKTDRSVVENLLRSAGVEDFNVIVADGHLHPKVSLRRLANLNITPPSIVVYDQDSGSVGDAVEPNKVSLDAIFCPAIPSIEAWLFADSAAFFEVLGEKAEAFQGRLPLPEQLPYPKFLKSTMLRDARDYHRLLQTIDVRKASARSPSLKFFLQSARRLSGLAPMDVDTPDFKTGQMTREVLRNLISEVYPSSKPLFRSASGAIVTAEQMMQEITDGTDLGREYASDILRVARDLLSRQAQKHHSGPPSE